MSLLPALRATRCTALLLGTVLASLQAAAADSGPPWTTIFSGMSTSGLAVDRTNGDVYAVVEGTGVYKSIDQGKTFAVVDSSINKSHAETGCALSIDPEGGRLMCFMNYGSAGGTLDGGKTWFTSTQGNWNWGCVDWSDPMAKTMLANSHGGGSIQLTTDAGKTWTRINGAAGGHVGVADATSLLVGGGSGIFLSTANGSNWQKVSDFKPKGRVMRVFKGKCYWLDDTGVIVSADHGRTWTRMGTMVDGCVGPFFGADEHSMVVVGLAGFAVTHDDGGTWRIVAALPDSIKTGWSAPEGGDQRPYWFVQFGWDPKANILYASSLHAPVQKCALPIDKEVFAQVDHMITQLKAIKDPAGAPYRSAAIKLSLSSATLALDTSRVEAIQAVTAEVMKDLQDRQQAILAGLSGDPAAYDKLVTEDKKLYAGTLVAPWFNDAITAGKAHAQVASFIRSGTGTIATRSKEAMCQKIAALKAKVTVAEFQSDLDALSASVKDMAIYEH
jgi:hypothetical protein